MSPSKLTRMAFSHHSRYTDLDPRTRAALNACDRVLRPHLQTKRLHGLLWALKRAFQRWRLIREKRALERSFARVAETMGLPMDRQQQTYGQRLRLVRIRQIEAELRNLRTTDQ